ncbi:hypothetical protein Sjap_012957 [Stephania japonica]|uniref:Uncharacterized protein n=1 Tax=Stephania japonica TaxID=461633 RepID=A0AAP0NZF2_9MAGN
MAISEEDSSSVRSRADPKGVYYLAKCVLRGSVVLQAVQGHIRSPSSNDIVFGKETSIELVVIDEDGILQSVCEQNVFGTIKDLAILRWNMQFCDQNQQMLGKDLLVVLSDSGKLSLLTFCNEMHRFFAVSHVQLSNPGNLLHQPGRMLAIDSLGSFVAVSAYKDRLALLSISMSAGNDIVDKVELTDMNPPMNLNLSPNVSSFQKLFYPPENEGNTINSWDIHRNAVSGTIWSMCFIPKDASQLSKDGYSPVLAVVLNRNGTVLNELLLLGWNTRENNIAVLSQYTDEAGPIATNIVEVPNSFGFALLFRVGDILLMDVRDTQSPSCVYRIDLSILPNIMLQDSVEQSYRGLDGDDEGNFNVAACALLELRDSRMEINKTDDPMSVDNDYGRTASSLKFMCCWDWEQGDLLFPRMIFSLNTGGLFVIEIYSSPDGVRVNVSDCLYRCPPCNKLLWVGGELIAGLVEMGDGMVLQFEHGRLLYRSPIQNIAPILDMSVVDYHNERQDQMFACCGMAPEGSLRIIRSGINVEKLLSTTPTYQGITGTWAMRMNLLDSYHSFLVLSFVEETRVLSVGLSFSDVTDAVGFQPDVSTLACGLLVDRLLVQIHRNAVRLCVPTEGAHSDGLCLPAPICISWFPENVSISVGAVGHNLIVIATSSPCLLYIIGVRTISSHHYELYEMQHVRMQTEVSCISIPQHCLDCQSRTSVDVLGSKSDTGLPRGVQIDRTFVIGTHKPSVEILSFTPENMVRVLASGAISLTDTLGTAVSGCVPQDVRLVLVDRLYVLSGLRNGMLLRFEWPVLCTAFPSESTTQSTSTASALATMNTSLSSMASLSFIRQQYYGWETSETAGGDVPVHLQLIAIRRIGVTPVFLVPLHDSLDADIIALSDRPWLLQTARHSLSYASISFQPATHATPVCSVDCPKGILFVAESSLHLVEMVHSRRLNVQKFQLGGTPRKVLYHSESRLLVVMRTDLKISSSGSGLLSSSDVCLIDPLSGSLIKSHPFGPGEIGKSMQLVKVGNEQVLVVGTSQSAGRPIMPSGEAESSKGCLLVISIIHTKRDSSSNSSNSGSSSQYSSPLRDQPSSSRLCGSLLDDICDELKECKEWKFQQVFQTTLPGAVLAVCPYLERYFLASAGNILYVYGFLNDNPQRVKKFALGKTRFTITCLTSQFNRIAVGDCRDGILFYSYQEDLRKLEQLYCDPDQRLVADCNLMNLDTAAVADRRGHFALLSSNNHLEVEIAKLAFLYFGDLLNQIATKNGRLLPKGIYGGSETFQHIFEDGEVKNEDAFGILVKSVKGILTYRGDLRVRHSTKRVKGECIKTSESMLKVLVVVELVCFGAQRKTLKIKDYLALMHFPCPRGTTQFAFLNIAESYSKTLRMGPFTFKLSADDVLKGCDGADRVVDLSSNSIIEDNLDVDPVTFNVELPPPKVYEDADNACLLVCQIILFVS